MKYRLIHIHVLFFVFSVIPAESRESNFIKVQYEMRDFENSKQKIDGINKTVDLELNLGVHMFKAAYERTDTNTKAHIPKDLEVEKVFARYGYRFDQQWKVYGGYIAIDDNLVSTDGGKIYSLGMQYVPTKRLTFDLTGYYGDYDIMKTCQVDARMVYRHAFGRIKSRSAIIAKQININECEPGAICSNAKNSYFTPGLMQSLSYEGYYAQVGAFFGKRVFAVMHDGFRVQHHAMEFNKTMMAAVGKKFGPFDLMFRYVYLEAEELPIKNSGVEVRNSVVSLGYRF